MSNKTNPARSRNGVRRLKGTDDMSGTEYHKELYHYSEKEIATAALNLLDWMLKRGTINLVCRLTGVARTTLYSWMDADRPIEKIDTSKAAWFVLFCETNPKVQLFLSRPPSKRPHLAGRALEAAAKEAGI